MCYCLEDSWRDWGSNLALYHSLIPSIKWIYWYRHCHKHYYVVYNLVVNSSLAGGGVKWLHLLSQVLALSILIFMTPNQHVNFLNALLLIFKTKIFFLISKQNYKLLLDKGTKHIAVPKNFAQYILFSFHFLPN